MVMMLLTLMMLKHSFAMHHVMCGTPLKNKGPFELNGMVKKHKGIDTENVNAKFACDDSCTLKFKRSSLYMYY